MGQGCEKERRRTNLDTAQFHGYCAAIKNLTISLDEATYRTARAKAAGAGTSLSRVVADYLEDWTGSDARIEEARRTMRTLFEQPSHYRVGRRLPREALHARRASRKKFEAALAEVPDRAPAPEDRLD